MFAMISESLTEDERRELTDLNSAAITYYERVREILVCPIERRLTDLRAEQALWSGTQDMVLTSDHAVPNSGEAPSDSPSAGIVSSEPDHIAPESELTCGNARIEHIIECENQREATFVIGELNPTGIAVSEAAALIHAAGLSKGRVDTVMSNIHSYMSGDDAWQKLAPSRFRLLPKIREVIGVNAEQPQEKIAEERDDENEIVQVA